MHIHCWGYIHSHKVGFSLAVAVAEVAVNWGRLYPHFTNSLSYNIIIIIKDIYKAHIRN